MRPLIVEEPYSKAALLSRRLAMFSLAVAVIGILGVSRDVDLIAVLGGALVIACAAVLFAILAFVVIWRSGRTVAFPGFRSRPARWRCIPRSEPTAFCTTRTMAGR